MMKLIKKILREIFSAEPYPETPLTAALFLLYAKELWARLGIAGPGGMPLKITIYGAGRHTAWLLQSVENIKPGPQVVAVLDDAPSNSEFHGIPLIPTSAFDPSSADLILLSSDTVFDKMEQNCLGLFGDKIKILNMYKELRPGPYFKHLEQFTRLE